MTSQKKRIAVYLRVSTAEQAKEGHGLDSQLRLIKDEIKKHESEGWIFDETLLYREEGESGKLWSRPVLNKLRKDISDGKIDILIVWKLDRLFRRMQYLLTFVDELTKYKVNFKSVSEIFDTTTPAGQFMFQVFGALAELERNMIVDRGSEGKITAAMEGKYVGGAIPFGYTVKDKKLVPLEAEAKWVRRIFTWFVDQEYSAEKIAQTLIKMGVPTKTDKLNRRASMSRRKKNPIGFWNPSVVRKILNRSNYRGIYYYNKYGVDDNGKRYEKDSSEWTEIECEPLISDDLFNKARVRLDTSKHFSNSAKTTYLFSGKIFCGVCGSAYSGCMSSKKTKNYRCLKNNNFKSHEKCKASQISEDILGGLIWEKVEYFLKQPESTLKKIHQEIRKGSNYQILLDLKEELLGAKEKNTQARDGARRMFRKGVYSEDVLEDELKILDQELSEINDELHEISIKLTTEVEKEDKILSVKEMAKKYMQNLKNPSYENKRELFHRIVERITITGSDINLEVKIPRYLRDEIIKSKMEYGVTGQI